jgi:hypothetical protein
VCDEHRVRIFENQRLWEKGQRGELRHHVVSKLRQPAFIDHAGKRCTHNEEHFLFDDSFPKSHDRHIVLRGHCFRADDGTIGASGKIDPKEMVIGDVNYRQLEFKNPRCELCESGDMIPPWRRFKSSKYRPSFWRYLAVRIRALVKA